MKEKNSILSHEAKQAFSYKAIVAALKQELGSGSSRLYLIAVLGVILLLVGHWGDAVNQWATQEKKNEQLKPTAATITHSYEETLESKLAQALGQVKGAGNVTVHLTVDNNGIQEPARNIVKESKVIQEKDSHGGTKTTTETKANEQILVSREGGIDRPVILQEHKPVLRGVLIIAEGAGDSQVKLQLVRAAESYLGLPAYRITVLPQRR